MICSIITDRLVLINCYLVDLSLLEGYFDANGVYSRSYGTRSG